MPGLSRAWRLVHEAIRGLDQRMRITKYEHATLAVEKDNHRVVIDPGMFLASLTDLSRISAVIITHAHPDHWSAGNLARIREANPEAPIFGPQGVADAATDFSITVVAPGDVISYANFTLEFFGGKHAVIHESIPVIDNVGVMIDDYLYYPGDSYDAPADRSVEVLAAPLGAPWLKISEAMDFVLAVAPKQCFGTHDMTLSVIGRNMHVTRLEWATQQGGGQFHHLSPGAELVL